MPEVQVKASEIAKMPHLDPKAFEDGRAVPLFPVLLDDAQGKWGMWVPGPPDGGLVRLKSGNPIESTYFAKEPDGENDIHVPFFELTSQRLLYPWLNETNNALRNDLYNLAAAVATLRVLHKASQADNLDVRRCAEVQLEYILTTCRSIYDLAQVFLAAIYKGAKWKDPELEKKRKATTMPRSFADVVCVGESGLKDKAALTTKLGLPDPWVEFYLYEGPFFVALRGLRDDIVHSGQSLPYVSTHVLGFIIPSNDPGIRKLYKMPIEHLLPGNPNGIGSLMSLVGYVINCTLDMLYRLTDMLAKHQLPRESAPNYHVFLRGSHLHYLVSPELPIKPEHNPWFKSPLPPSTSPAG